jgi:hypothetical protein
MQFINKENTRRRVIARNLAPIYGELDAVDYAISIPTGLLRQKGDELIKIQNIVLDLDHLKTTPQAWHCIFALNINLPKIWTDTPAIKLSETGDMITQLLRTLTGGPCDATAIDLDEFVQSFAVFVRAMKTPRTLSVISHSLTKLQEMLISSADSISKLQELYTAEHDAECKNDDNITDSASGEFFDQTTEYSLQSPNTSDSDDPELLNSHIKVGNSPGKQPSDDTAPPCSLVEDGNSPDQQPLDDTEPPCSLIVVVKSPEPITLNTVDIKPPLSRPIYTT